MKHLIFPFFLILFSFTKIQAQSAFIDYDKNDFEETKFEKPVLMFFCSLRCNISRSMRNEVFRDSSLKEFLANNFTCIEVESNKNVSDLITKYNLNYVPAFVFLNNNKDLIYKTSGYYQAADFKEKADYVLKKIKGNVTISDDLAACKDADDCDCEHLLKKFYKSGEWKSSNINAELAFSFVLMNYKNSWKHFQDNKATYYELLKKEKIEGELYILVLNEAEELLLRTDAKDTLVNWNKVDKIFKKYFTKNYDKHLLLMKSQIAMLTENWDLFFHYRTKALEIELTETNDSLKTNLFYKRHNELYDLSYNFDELTEKQENLLLETCYVMLQNAERYLVQPDYKVYQDLEIICARLGKYDESNKYAELAEELKNKSEKNDKQKDSDD